MTLIVGCLEVCKCYNKCSDGIMKLIEIGFIKMRMSYGSGMKAPMMHVH